MLAERNRTMKRILLAALAALMLSGCGGGTEPEPVGSSVCSPEYEHVYRMREDIGALPPDCWEDYKAGRDVPVSSTGFSDSVLNDIDEAIEQATGIDEALDAFEKQVETEALIARCRSAINMAKANTGGKLADYWLDVAETECADIPEVR